MTTYAAAFDINAALPVILGAGGIGFLHALWRIWQSFHSSAEQREAKAVGNLERWRDEADRRARDCIDDLDLERQVRAYWQRRTAAAEAALVRAQVDVPYSEPPPFGG